MPRSCPSQVRGCTAFLFFSPIVSQVCTEFWVLHRREPGPRPGLAAGSLRHLRLCRAGTSCLSLPVIILLPKERDKYFSAADQASSAEKAGAMAANV